MKSYILTEKDRMRLNAWIETGREDRMTRKLFTDIRNSLPVLMDDILLIIKTRKKLKREKRWAKRRR